MSGLDIQRRDWDDLAAVDPYWAVLTDPERKHGGWDEAAFFATGEAEVDALLDTAATLAMPAGRASALDFGCGPGRVSRALAPHFDHVVGVDISKSLIDFARSLNADVPNCEFRVSSAPDLAPFADSSLDLVYSNIVLQHQPNRRIIRAYIAEFLRTVRAGGLVVFQLPVAIPWRNRIQPRRRTYSLLRKLGAQPEVLYRRFRLHPLRMTFMPRREVTVLVEGSGGRVVEAKEDSYAGAFPSVTYFVTRAGTGAAAEATV